METHVAALTGKAHLSQPIVGDDSAAPEGLTIPSKVNASTGIDAHAERLVALAKARLTEAADAVEELRSKYRFHIPPQIDPKAAADACDCFGFFRGVR
jgi:hypothetical protein